MAKLELQGSWWLPDGSHSLPGTLEFNTQQGGTLTTTGSLSALVSGEETSRPEDILSPSELPDRIFGTAQSGEQITLWGPVMTRYQGRSVGPGAGTDSEEYITQLLYIGDHIEDEPEFGRFTFTFPKLHEWSDESLVRPILERDQLNEVVESNRDAHTGYVAMEPKQWCAEIADCKICIFSGVSTERDGDSVKMGESTTVSVEPDSPCTFQELRLKVTRPIWQYFTMALGKPVYPIDISAGSISDTAQVEIYPMFSHYDEDLELNITDFNFRWSDVDLEQSLKDWFEHTEVANSLHSYYFAHRYNDEMYLNFDFLSLVVALESYHESVVDSPKVIPKEEFKDILDDVEGALPSGSEIETRVMNLLRPIGNQYPLKTQLNHVLGEYEEMLDSLIDIESTSSDANTIRNQIAHGYATPDTDKMIDCLPKLQAVIDTILLDAIGLEAGHIQETLAKNYGNQLNSSQQEE